MEGRLQIFTGNAHPELAAAICRHLEGDLGRAIVSMFKNGETRVKLDENVRGADAFVIQPTFEPVNDYIMEILLMIDALRRASAARITAVIPYYGYAKQEKKTSGREPISAKLVANLLTTAGANRVLAIDLHSPAIEGFFDIPVDHLRGSPLLARAFRNELQGEIVVVSPDAGGVSRAQEFRTRAKGSLAIISKQHPDADKTEMLDIVGDVDGRTAVIVDDMIATGGTLVEAAKLLKDRGAEKIYVCATHGIFAGDALKLIADSDIDHIYVTDTIPLPENAPAIVSVVSIAPLLAEAIMRTHKGMSISALFT